MGISITRRTVIEPKPYVVTPNGAERRMNHIFVAITTYDRPESFKVLLENLHKNLGTYTYTIRVYDDASNENYIENEWYKKLNDVCDISYIRYGKNKGKKGYWEIINQVLHDASMSDAGYFFLLQDDCVPVDDFFTESISQWDGIEDTTKGTMCTFIPKTVYTRTMWNRARAKDVVFKGQYYINCGYVDCIFMCPMDTLQKLDFRLEPIPKTTWDYNPNQSSGVGLQLSTRLKKLGMTMYGVWSSLIVMDEQASKMNPKERKAHPLFSLHRNIEDMPRVYVGMASVVGRERELKDAVESLYDQVDVMYVYLNNYTFIPDFLERPKIEIFTSQYHGDMGDAGKFFKVQDCDGYFFSCDDDLIYPSDYVVSTIHKIELYERKSVVTYHGAILNELPIKSYYNDRKQLHFKKEQHNDITVHIGGTGVTAFHTDTIKVKYADFPIANMADIWMGVLCQEQNIPIRCLSRSFGWIKMSPFTNNTKTIYSKFKLDDSPQTNIINSREWKLHAN